MRSRPGGWATSPSARCLTGMSRPEGRQAVPSKELSTVIRRYDGSGSVVVIRTSSTSAPRVRSRLRSTIGLEMRHRVAVAVAGAVRRRRTTRR